MQYSYVAPFIDNIIKEYCMIDPMIVGFNKYIMMKELIHKTSELKKNIENFKGSPYYHEMVPSTEISFYNKMTGEKLEKPILENWILDFKWKQKLKKHLRSKH